MAGEVREAAIEMSPIEVQSSTSNAPAPASGNMSGEKEEQQGFDDEEGANIPLFSRRSDSKLRTCISPHAVCSFIGGVLATLVVVAIANQPFQGMEPDCRSDERADLTTPFAFESKPSAPGYLPAADMQALEAMEGDLHRLVRYIVEGQGRGEAYNRTADFVDRFGHRQAGSESLEQSIDFLLDTLRATEGLSNVHGFDVMVPRWVRGNESCTLLEPTVSGSARSLAILGLGFSVGTQQHPGGLEAEILVVGSLAELVSMRAQVAGKIVLMDMPYTTYGNTRPYRTHSASLVAKLGGVGLLLRSVAPFSLNTPHTGSMSYLSGPLDREMADRLGFGPGVVPDELLGDYSSVSRIPAAALAVEDAAMIRRMSQRQTAGTGARVRVLLYMEARDDGQAVTRNVIADVPGTGFSLPL
jgi:hypothetical protein